MGGPGAGGGGGRPWPPAPPPPPGSAVYDMGVFVDKLMDCCLVLLSEYGICDFNQVYAAVSIMSTLPSKDA